MTIQDIYIQTQSPHPLVQALRDQNFKLIQRYHSQGIYFLFPGKITPLHMAVLMNSTKEIVNLLLKFYKNLTTSFGLTATDLDQKVQYNILSEKEPNNLFQAIIEQKPYQQFFEDVGKQAKSAQNILTYINSLGNTSKNIYYQQLIPKLKVSRDSILGYEDQNYVQYIILSGKLSQAEFINVLQNPFTQCTGKALVMKQLFEQAIQEQLLDAISTNYINTYLIEFGPICIQISYKFALGSTWSFNQIIQSSYFALQNNFYVINFFPQTCEQLTMRTAAKQKNCVLLPSSLNFVQYYYILKQGFDTSQVCRPEQKLQRFIFPPLQQKFLQTIQQIISQLLFYTYKGFIFNYILKNNIKSYQIVKANFFFGETKLETIFVKSYQSLDSLANLVIELCQNQETYQILGNSISVFCQNELPEKDEEISLQIQDYLTCQQLQKSFTFKESIERNIQTTYNYDSMVSTFANLFVLGINCNQLFISKIIQYNIQQVSDLKQSEECPFYLAILEKYKLNQLEQVVVQIKQLQFIFDDYSKFNLQTTHNDQYQVNINSLQEANNFVNKFDSGTFFIYDKEIIYFQEINLLTLPIILSDNNTVDNINIDSVTYAYNQLSVIRESCIAIKQKLKDSPENLVKSNKYNEEHLEPLDFEQLLVKLSGNDFTESPRIIDEDLELAHSLNIQLKNKINLYHRKIFALRSVYQKAQVVTSCIHKQSKQNNGLPSIIKEKVYLNRVKRNALLKEIQKTQLQILQGINE